MAARLALGFVAALLLTAGIGFGAYGLFLALVPHIEPALSALTVGAGALGLAALLLVPVRRRSAPPAPVLKDLTTLAAEHPLAAVFLSTLTGVADAARR
ncbi:hypothetical protein [Zavarzinia aquatilis]|uniref:Uncharacterized protein n=1 Tax=Zavarzinia aquatilis TaxID=2211142 RepID=A0A317E485_9PROT|nr:hypothetical protein [Zavarzinia aquatilis]PWR21392.1 hypothetical protein DKG74_13225 [Zavarzinia aquatilis]